MPAPKIADSNFTDFSIFKKRRFGWPHAPHGRASLSSGLTREIREAIRFHIEGLKEDDLTIPSPTVITDHATAIANRKKLLDMASTSKRKLLGYRWPQPGVGLTEVKDGAYVYVPAA